MDAHDWSSDQPRSLGHAGDDGNAALGFCHRPETTIGNQPLHFFSFVNGPDILQGRFPPISNGIIPDLAVLVCTQC